MKRLILLSALAAALTFASSDAQAACQKCNNEFTVDAMCYSLTGSETSQAEYDSCWEVPHYTPDGQLDYETCDGSPAPASCFSTGGGGKKDPLEEFEGENGGSCSGGVLGCPAECSSCG
ncbi:MAG TPA: hypothetical protein VEK11_02485 [Thermoanaerobaculia bacterium]|nr:hypothetical protein [Thermoanaerobaculia bacterium]